MDFDSLTTRPPLNEAAVADLMRRVLLHADSLGWEDRSGNFAVYVLYEAGDHVTGNLIRTIMQGMGDPIIGDLYVAQPLLATFMFDPDTRMANGQDSPADTLMTFAMNMGFTDLARLTAAGQEKTAKEMSALRQLLKQPGVCGFMAVSEAWGFRTMTPLLAGLIESGMPIDTIAGAEQARIVLAGDIHGRLHEAKKWRADDDIAVAHGVHWCNEVTVSLRVLADVARDEGMPASPAEFRDRYHRDCDDEPDEG